MIEKMKKGFTLIELLIVIAIIGVLSALITVGYNSAKVNSRDAKRISDIGALDSAARLMYEDTKKILTGACSNNTWTVLDVQLNNVLVPDYINTIPLDPKTTLSNKGSYGIQYLYVSTTATYNAIHASGDCSSPVYGASHYLFYANLENADNQYININTGQIDSSDPNSKYSTILDSAVDPGDDNNPAPLNRYVVSGP